MDLSVMDVVLNVDQNDLPRVKLGQTASVTVNEVRVHNIFLRIDNSL